MNYIKMQKVIYQRPNHFSYLKVMREQNQLCDVTIQVERQIFPVHRCILAGTMEYFKTMFLDDFKENQEEIISIKNITATNMKTLIDFAYTGEIVLTEDTVESLMKDADYLLLIEVKEECARFLESTLHCTNAYKIYCMAEELSCISLKEKSYKFIREHAQDIAQTEEFLGLNHSCLKDIVIDNDHLSPTIQFEALMRWIINDFDKRKIHLSEILNCSSFFKLTLEYLTDYIFKEDVVAAIPESEHRNLVADVLLLYRNLKKKKHEPKEHIGIVDLDARMNIYDPYNSTQYTISPHPGQKYHIRVFEPGTKMVASSLYHESMEFVQRCQAQLLDCKNLIPPWYEPFAVDARQFPSYTDKWTSIELSGLKIRWSGRAVHENQLYHVSSRIEKTNHYFLYRYNLQEEKWENVTIDRYWTSAAEYAFLDDYLYVCHGREAENYILNDVMRYCPTTKEWRQMTSMQTTRAHMAVVAFSGHLYAIGGYNNNGHVNTVERYDPQRDCWTTFPSLQSKRSVASAAILNGKIFICGGVNNKTAEAFDPIANRWDFVAPMNVARQGALVVAHAGKLWAFGGLKGNQEKLSSAEVYDSEQNSWSYVSEMPTCKGYSYGGVLLI